MFDELKGYFTGMAVRWILKVAGGFLLSVGVSSDNVTAIVSAVISILVGLAISLFQQKKAVNQDPLNAGK